MTTAEFLAARAAWAVEKDEFDAWCVARVAAIYAQLHDENRIAGRDLSGKSVQARKGLAYDRMVQDDAEYRARRSAVDQLWRAFIEEGI